jgi:hypothetical protein
MVPPSRERRQRAIAGKARRHRWHSWQQRQHDFRKLQALKAPSGSESHPLRQFRPFLFNNLPGPSGFSRVIAGNGAQN